MDIIQRLKDACVGHPYAKIPWPHRLLHDAVDEIESLRVQRDTWYFLEKPDSSWPTVSTHKYNPHPKYPWFCRQCGYPEHERLKHALPAPPQEDKK